GVFGRNGERWPPLMVLKGAVGHTLGGCALVETVASLLALARGEIPISARCAEPDPELALGRTRGDAMTSPWALDPRWVLLKCTNGFAGQNGAMVLRSVDGRRPPPPNLARALERHGLGVPTWAQLPVEHA